MVKLEDFKNQFLNMLEKALNNAGKTLSSKEKIIINEFVNQAKANNLTELTK